MGAMLEPTPAMGPWHVEVRRESAYLYGENPNWTPADGPEPAHTVRAYSLGDTTAFAISARNLDAVIAAVRQIMDSEPYRRWQETHVTDATSWDAELVDGWLQITGPVIVYGTWKGWQAAGTVELAYQDLTGLLDTLTQAKA